MISKINFKFIKFILLQIECEPTQETCSDGVTCKEKHWFCDGENDCSDGSDEFSCRKKLVWIKN